MRIYHPKLKRPSRVLRSRMTDAEQKLWYRLRRKQLRGVQFYRQKPLGEYIVDFYAHQAKLVVELDGAQHLEPSGQEVDRARDAYLAKTGVRVLRFNNLEVLQQMEHVLQKIDAELAARIETGSD